MRRVRVEAAAMDAAAGSRWLRRARSRLVGYRLMVEPSTPLQHRLFADREEAVAALDELAARLEPAVAVEEARRTLPAQQLVAELDRGA